MISRSGFFLPALVAALLGSSTLVSGAAAQSTAAASADKANCDTLKALIRDNGENLRTDWINKANDITRAGQLDQCRTFYEQASAALNNRDADGNSLDEQQRQAAARIVVTQPSPDVRVQQSAPQVAVTQDQPQVTVDQGRPQIEVRQQTPTIHVQMPQPVITIDQPQPQITVRMPNPQVAVNTPQPQVEVNQAQPRVSVSQAQPHIEVQPTRNAPAQPNIDVRQQDAQVRQSVAEGAPKIDVNGAEPQVKYMPAKPDIQVEQMGQPEVRFNQTGEAEVRIEPMTNSPEADNAQTAEARTTPDQPANTNAASATGQGQQPQMANSGKAGESAATHAQRQADALALIRRPDVPKDNGQMVAYNVSDIVGQTLVNWHGDTLGRIERLVTVGNANYLVLAPDTPLSDGNRGVVLPLNTVSVIDDHLVMRGMNDDELRELQSYDSTNLRRIAPSKQVRVATK